MSGGCHFLDHQCRETLEQSPRWENGGKTTLFQVEITPWSIIWNLLSGSQEIYNNINMNTTTGQELQTPEGSVIEHVLVTAEIFPGAAGDASTSGSPGG